MQDDVYAEDELGARSRRSNPSRSSGRSNSAQSSRRAQQTERSSRQASSSRASRKQEDAERRGQSRSKGEARRRERTKARAEKMFSKQYASDSSASEQVEGAPRAALYEAKMGSQHRRSARMQRASSASSPSAKVNMAGWLSSIPFTARSIKIATAVLCVFLFCAFLYAPAQQYYQAQREHDKLVVEYSTIEERNTALNEQNDILASDAGMEDAVRQKYGYVKSGEQVAYVAGLSDEASEARRDSDDLQANVLSSTVKAPDEWYTPLLDAFFGVK